MITFLAAAFVAHTTSRPIQANPKVKFSKYQAELRIPVGGLFAQEETDVEFRVVDTTQKDPVEEGFKGVGAIDASATMTMPEMMGMPMVKPSVHREGVPGDYGLVLFFAHGGQYQIDLDLKIPNDGTKHIKFLVDVKDERPAHMKLLQPYRLDLQTVPKQVKAGQPTELRLQVIDTKTKRAQTTFDVTHEKQFHLMIVSKDLNWFRHEHPTMQPDGTWIIKQIFPAGTTYWVYGDVAPSGKGSRILMNKITVSGTNPTWNTKPKISYDSVSNGLKGSISGSLGRGRGINVGQNTVIPITLTDAHSRAPAAITENYLGAKGHLMIFSEDGQTAVHSHPIEGQEADIIAKIGVVRFNARFPKPGLYKAYAQFMYHGGVKTLGFTIMVKK